MKTRILTGWDIKRYVVLWLFLIFIAAVCSCSGGDSSPASPAPPTAAAGLSGDWRIQIWAGPPGNRVRVSVPPLAEYSGPPTAGSQGVTMAGLESKGLRPTGVVDTPDGSVSFDQTQLSDRTGWILLAGAAATCGVVRNNFGAPGYLGLSPVVPPWSAGANFIFLTQIDSCDRLLAYQQSLLCIAAKLEEVADAVGVIYWEEAQELTDPLPTGPYLIPPQRTEDRFIARDLALHVLAHLSFFDNAYPDDLSQNCTEAYSSAYSNPSGVASPLLLFSSSAPLPPTGIEPDSAEHIRQLAAARLLVKSHILRAAARLTIDLVEKSVEADMAGAEQRRAHAGDPTKGSMVYWGIRSQAGGGLSTPGGAGDGDPPYNSLAHAVRVLGGRLEQGTRVLGGPDPICGALRELDVIQAYGQDFDVRWTGREVTTPGQEAALRLVEDSGIVLPKSSVENLKSSALRAALGDQLVWRAAVKNGFVGDDTHFRNDLQGKSLLAVVDQVSDADLRFAFSEVLNSYRLLTMQPISDDLSSPTTATLRAPGEEVNPNLTTGLVLSQGVPKRDLAVGASARMGGVQSASQCARSPLGGASEGGLRADNLAMAFELSFQNAFGLGQQIKRRLVRLRELAANAGLNDSKQASAIAAAAVAEVGAWAGHGRLMATGFGPDQPVVITLRTVGFLPEDWGAPDADGMQNKVGLVYGEPWVAECAARLRTACPENFDKEWMSYPTSQEIHALTGEERMLYGADGTLGTFDFEIGGQAVYFSPQYTGIPAASPATKHLYVVLLHDPSRPAQGKILGALALRANGGDTGLNLTTVAVSDRQRELFDGLLGVDKQWSIDGSRIGKRDKTFSASYCIPGVPWDQFVPLENELNTDSNQEVESSWAHYLSLFKQATERCDSLGEQLIQQGLQKDFRREAAQEELAQICGDYAALGDLEVSNGKVEPRSSSKDQSTNNCLAEPTYDVVFLTEDQKTISPNSTDPQAFLRKVLKCDESTGDSRCQREITSAGLNLVKAQDSGLGSAPVECSSSISIVRSLATGFSGAKLKHLSTEQWMSPDMLRAVAQTTYLETYLEPAQQVIPRWRLMSRGSTIMDSGKESGVWPGCRLPNATPCSASDPGPELFDQMYRRGQPGTPLGDPQIDGTGEQEAALIGWRVEGSLWVLGALTGGIPLGSFQKYVPAADFATGSFSAPVPAVYGHSKFEGDSTAGWVLGELDYDLDRKIVGKATVVPVNYYPTTEEVPVWIRNVYANGSSYRHVLATLGEKQLGSGQEVGKYLSARADDFEGLTCADGANLKFAGVGGSTAKSAAGAAAVGTLKTGELLLVCNNPATNWGVLWMTSDATGRVQTHLRDMVLPVGYPPGEVIPLFPLSEEDSIVPQPWGLGMSGWFMQPRSQAPTYDDTYFADCAVDPLNPLVQEVSPACLKDKWYLTSEEKSWGALYTLRTLLPQVCSPNDRVAALINSYAPVGECGAAAQIAQAVALACQLSNGDIFSPPTQPPKVRSPADFLAFQRWINEQARRARLIVSNLFLEDVPIAVVNDIKANKVSAGLNGDHGRLLSQMGTSIRAIFDGWQKVALDLDQLAAAVDATNGEIYALKVQEKKELIELSIRQMQVHVRMVQAIADAVAAYGVGVNANPVGGAAKSLAAGATVIAGFAELGDLSDLRDLTEDQGANQVLLAFIHLQQTSQPIYADLEISLRAIQSSVAETMSIASQLRQAESKAQYETAKGLGADYCEIDGKVVEFPVNTVLRRDYEITRRRYESALKEAKYLGFVARLAIEQRIGARLNTLAENVGPLEPPKVWADDICKLQGIDYEKMRTFYDAGAETGPSEQEEQGILDDLAKQYVGDYAARLENFVTYYNIKYPSHEGDDTVALSLRDDLLAGPGSCIKTSPNLLYYSSQLDQADFVQEDGQAIRRGWQVNQCDAVADRCLRVSPEGSLTAPNSPPAAQTGGGVTWLHETGRVIGQFDGGVEAAPPSSDAQAGDSGLSGPTRTVWQTVRLTPGAYILSWWDQARDAEGKLQTAGTTKTLQVGIYGEDWTPVQTVLLTPDLVPASALPEVCGDAADAGCDPDALWSARRTLRFKVSAEAVFHVAFSVSLLSENPGSVAIANVQLEQTTAPNSPPSPYIGNAATRQYLSADCSGRTPSQLQSAFVYRCASDANCYYELAEPVLIDTGKLGTKSSNLNGKLASGNYNFRHITVALNLVGTGVHDCGQNSGESCYGSGFTEYTLSHDAFKAGILDYEGKIQQFNFGLANINHGKALAAERYITTPIGSGDQALLAQPSIEKKEFRGRPLDGSYKIRIWDNPNLVWNRLEDIQLVLKYRYWSSIQQQPGTP